MSSGGKHFIPRPDAEAATWAAAFYDALQNWWNAQGWSSDDLADVKTAIYDYIDRCNDHTAA